MWAPPCPSCVDAMADKYSTTPRKRRRRPYGRVFRRPGGPGWLVQFPDPSGRKAPSGRTAYVTRSFETKAEGEALLREIRKEVLKGTLARPAAEPEISDMTVRPWTATSARCGRKAAPSPRSRSTATAKNRWLHKGLGT